MGESSVDDVYEQVRNALPAAAYDAPRTLAPVAPGIRVLALRTPTLPPAAHTNVYVVGPDDGGRVYVVDPGSPWPEQQAILVEALGGQDVAAVLLTHHHGDHVGGAAALGVPVWAHAKTARRLRVPVARELGDGETFDGIRCVFTPGHAEGHLCFEVGGGGAVIAGDMVAGLGTILIDPDEGDMTQYLASLETLLARGTQLLLPAHGPPITDGPGKLREYIAHRMMREQRIVAALAGGEMTTDALVAAVYADTPRILWPLAERSLRAHLAKLVREHRAFEQVPGRWTSTASPL